MPNPNYDDPVIDEKWCYDRRAEVVDYLTRQGIVHGQIGEWPAWHITPYVSIWAVESHKKPEWLGWWVICGDLPTDYISAQLIKHPREAIQGFAERWQEVASYMAQGKPHPTIKIGSSSSWPELTPLLQARAKILLEYANEDTIWTGA